MTQEHVSGHEREPTPSRTRCRASTVVVATRNRPELLRARPRRDLGPDLRGRDRLPRRLRPVRAGRDRGRSSRDSHDPRDHQRGERRDWPGPATPASWPGSASSSPSATTTTSGCRPRSRSRSRPARRLRGPHVGDRDHRGVRRPRGHAGADAERHDARALVRNRSMEAHPSTVMVRREALLGPDRAGGRGDTRQLRRGLRLDHPRSAGRRSRWWRSRSSACAGGSRCSPRSGRRSSTPSTTASPSTRSSTRTAALGRLYGRRAFALAALGNPAALRQAWRTARSPRGAARLPRRRRCPAPGLRRAADEDRASRGHGI